jgi:hypothetical protein
LTSCEASSRVSPWISSASFCRSAMMFYILLMI